MISTHVSKWPSALFGLIVGMLSLVMLLVIVLSSIFESELSRSQSLLRVINSVGDEADDVLITLNEADFDSCTDENLVLMRKKLFLAEYIKDIGFFKSGMLVCTTSKGLLPSPVSEGIPDFVGEQGFSIWTNQALILFDTSYRAFIAKYQNYNAVIDLEVLTRLDYSTFNWQVAHVQNGKTYHIIGKDGLIDPLVKQSRTLSASLKIKIQACSESHATYCAAVSIDIPTLAKEYPLLLILFFLICLGIGFAASSKHYNWRRRQRSLRTRISKGFAGDNFFWLFQPIVHMPEQKVIGCEVLARYTDQYGVITPDQFIPILRDLNFSWPFTKKVITQTLSELEDNQALAADFKVSFNIFPRDIMAMDHIIELANLPAIANSRFSITIEIVEDEHLDTGIAQESLKLLKQHGINTAIDDFGTGYSNLNQLKKICCQTLKIDRSFVMDMEESSVRSSLLPYIVGIAQELGMEIIAEGIETESQRQELTKLGVTLGQGWLFGKPMPASELSLHVNS